MANQFKKDYVLSLQNKFQSYPHFIIVGFDKTSHKRLEDLRNKLRETNLNPSFSIIKNSLFHLAYSKFNTSQKIISDENIQTLSEETKGKSALMLMPDDWFAVIKAFHQFAQEEDGMVFKVGVIDGKLYTKEGLNKLASLPSREVLVIKIIGSLKSSQSRIVYGLNYNMSKLVYILKNAKAQEASS